MDSSPFWFRGGGVMLGGKHWSAVAAGYRLLYTSIYGCCIECCVLWCCPDGTKRTIPPADLIEV